MLALPMALALAAGAEPVAPGCASFDLSLAGLGSLEEDLARTAGLAGSAPLWPGVLRRPSGARPLWLCDGPAPDRATIPDPIPIERLRWDLVPPTWLATLHTGWADDRNDGALWSGRGLSSSITAGVRARWRWLTAQLAPTAAWQMNHPFYVPQAAWAGQSPWANPFNYGSIDLPVRMGPSDFWTFDWGQSSLRLDVGAFAAGVSSENLWWGPGIRNSLLMSNSGPGIPHVFLGTSRPVDIWIGWLEVEVLWGRLRESRWFDHDPRNDRRLFEGVIYTFAPAFAPNFTLGFARVWLYPDDRVSWDVYLKPLVPPFLRLFTARPEQNGRENQLATLFGRWVLPVARLEIYGEWARDDFANNITNLLMDPWAASAFLLGLQHLIPSGEGWLRVQAELAHTYEKTGSLGAAIFYTHSSERQGYTQAGQMIGAGLGPQGDTQFLAVDWIRGRRRVGAYLERVVRNERYFNDVTAPAEVAAGAMPRHDLTMTYGLRGAWVHREWDVTCDLAVSQRYALNLGPEAWGVDATLRVSWWPGRAEAPALPGPGARAAAAP